MGCFLFQNYRFQMGVTVMGFAEHFGLCIENHQQQKINERIVNVLAFDMEVYFYISCKKLQYYYINKGLLTKEHTPLYINPSKLDHHSQTPCSRRALYWTLTLASMGIAQKASIWYNQIMETWILNLNGGNLEKFKILTFSIE